MDVETGLVTELRPVGGAENDRLWFTVTIHDADTPMDEVFAGRGRRRS